MTTACESRSNVTIFGNQKLRIQSSRRQLRKVFNRRSREDASIPLIEVHIGLDILVLFLRYAAQRTDGLATLYD